jgi:hypothetical protein
LLVCAGELEPRRRNSAITFDVDVEAMNEKLRCSCNGVAVESEEFGSQDIQARFDIAWKSEGFGVVVVNKLLIRPQSYYLISFI